mmetsp:Transcript_8616/g.35471  ORF Transcript_8616/g.35471 Transcript_8616/m.35471 type:complete len:204 (+) Transcript_8616:1180-1791(+)
MRTISVNSAPDHARTRVNSTLSSYLPTCDTCIDRTLLSRTAAQTQIHCLQLYKRTQWLNTGTSPAVNYNRPQRFAVSSVTSTKGTCAFRRDRCSTLSLPSPRKSIVFPNVWIYKYLVHRICPTLPILSVNMRKRSTNMPRLSISVPRSIPHLPSLDTKPRNSMAHTSCSPRTTPMKWLMIFSSYKQSPITSARPTLTRSLLKR